MLLKITSLDELNLVCEVVTGLLDDGYTIVLLEGELGAGKTTFVKAFCQFVGVMEPVSSPTFSLVQEYESPSRGIIYHMDFYRLENPGDLIQVGVDEYLHSGNICFIEWPGVGKAYYSMPTITISIQADNNNFRNFRITTHDEVDT